VLKHSPDLDRVWDDGFDMRCSCRRCNKPLLKDLARGWRELDLDVDYSGRGKLRADTPGQL
jgi:hypothetical protein